ncbi:MAG: enoyl-CoA hydratase/isomerase family protein [Anaerolineales bacterium]|nr:enoyl-CoA hydratase/isomerase family protein [Anaerolineales bacterium]HEY61017.1 3-hydroxyacyl-CoA dehydrogenase/enoyl-CoA hydratase family protein [Anaerolineae bacterium]
MKYKVHQAVVIGSGTMGAAIAAHFANIGVRVTLLDIVPRELTPKEEAKGLTLDNPKVRNRIVTQGLERAIKSRPASFYSKELASLITVGNLEDDFDAIGRADWIIEAVIENLKIKRNLMERVDEIRLPHAIVSTNTSGIQIGSIAEGRSEGFRKHFLGTHFFNPPRYLKLLEVIPTKETLPEVVDFISFFGEYRLGKGIVLCKDTPNFIANRFGFGTGAFALHYILENNYTVEEVDAITGPVIGRPKTATFRLIDLVGIDVWDHVGTNLAAAIPYDKHALKYLQSEPANHLIKTMVEKKWLGNKTKQGFYKQVRKDGKKEFWPLNLKTFEYQSPEKPRFESIGKVKDLDSLKERLEILLQDGDKAAKLVQALTYQGFAYASELIPEVADSPKPIDDAMCWGFGHQVGPFETWDMLGVEKMIEPMSSAGFQPAGWVKKMLDGGFKTFYQYDGERKIGVYNPILGEYESIKRSDAIIVLKEEKSKGKVVAQNAGATIIDLGDGVACVEFNTKMNTIDEDILGMMDDAFNRIEEGEFEGLVIGNDADNFSAGANLFGVVMAAQEGMWDQLEKIVKQLQDLNMRMKYFPQPIVVAPAGLTLGGGAEITMHGSRVVAASELYTGLVEVGAGVIPAGGGTKEMVRRILNPPMRTKDAEPFPFLQRLFEQVGMAKVATSAVEAREFGILGEGDRIVINRDHLIAEAKKEVLHMLDVGYSPPPPEKVYAAGRDVLAGLQVGLYMFKEGGYITEYESHIGGKLVYVMCGGEISKGTWMDEQYFLDLEREAFLSLCGEKKSQERMWHILQTGKPLRN